MNKSELISYVAKAVMAMICASTKADVDKIRTASMAKIYDAYQDESIDSTTLGTLQSKINKAHESSLTHVRLMRSIMCSSSVVGQIET